jgi:RND family efflux transporter MFP subunit
LTLSREPIVKRRTKRVVLAIGIGLLILGALTAAVNRFFELRATARQLTSERGARVAQDPLTHTVQPETRSQTRRHGASLRPWQESLLGFEVAGRVSTIRVDVGDRVGAGELLVELDNTLAQVAAAAAAERAAEAARRLEEAERLQGESAIRATEVTALRSAARLADLEREMAAEQLERHSLQAPFGGVVARRSVDVGLMASPGVPLITLLDDSRIRVVWFASEVERAALKIGNTVKLRSTRPDGAESVATVSRVSSAADPGTGLFRIEAELPNPLGHFAAHTSAWVETHFHVHQQTLFVPASAVRFVGRHAQVFRWDAARSEAEPVAVKLGDEFEGHFPVLEGLAAGDRILLR